MPSVDEHGELHAVGSPVVEQRVDRGADRAAGVEHVVDEHHRSPLERKVELGAVDDGLRPLWWPSGADDARRRGGT